MCKNQNPACPLITIKYDLPEYIDVHVLNTAGREDVSYFYLQPRLFIMTSIIQSVATARKVINIPSSELTFKHSFEM